MFSRLINPLAIIALAIILLSFNINKPFIGQHDFNGVQQGNSAKNFLKFGYLPLKFGQITSYLADLNNANSFYTSYLPTLAILISLSYKTFGISEISTRIIPIFFSCLGLIYFYLLIKKFWNTPKAVFASLFFILNPMFIYYGKMPVFDTIVLCFFIISTYYYILWFTSNKNVYLILLTFSVFLGGLFGWIIGYIIPIIIIHDYIFKRNWKVLYPTMSYLFTVVLLLLHAYILSSNKGSLGIFNTLQRRLFENNLNFGGLDFNLINYIKSEALILNAYFGKYLILSGIICLTISMLNIFRQKLLNLKDSIIFILFLFGIAHPIFFSKATFIHDYHNIYLLPFFSLSGGVVLCKITNYFKKIKFHLAINFVFILMVFALSFLDNLEYIKALNKSDLDKEGYKMASILNSIQTGNDQSLIVSPRFSTFYKIFCDYYSKHGYVISTWEILEQNINNLNYKYIITIDQDIKNLGSYNVLQSKYKNYKFSDITIFKTYD